MTRESVLEELRSAMVELFEIDPADVTLEASLADDLELDSIDSVDLIARMQELVGRRVETDAVRGVRTVGDVVTLVLRLAETDES